MVVLVVTFWLSFGALLWTHAVYPALAVLLARFVRREQQAGAFGIVHVCHGVSAHMQQRGP